MKRKREAAVNTPRKKLKRENATVNQQLVSLQRQIITLAKTEEVKQQIQANAGNVTIASGYAQEFNCCTRIAQGVAANNRIGAKITCLGLHLRFALRSRNNEITDPTIIRVIVFIDKQPITGSTTPPIFQTVSGPDGLLLNGTGSLATCGDNFVARRRYKKLYDKLVTINPQTVSDYDPVTGNSTLYFPEVRAWQKWIPLKNLKVMYNGTAGTADQIANNNIWVWMGQQATASAVGWYTDHTSRLFFTDA